MQYSLTLHPFRQEDFAAYRSWYADSELNARLGPMDEDWLTHVLAQNNGCTESFFNGNELVAVASILVPDAEHPAFYLTDFAIKPSQRSQGIGSMALSLLMERHPLQPGQSWRTFVDERNPRARAFFERYGWTCISEKPDAGGMWEMQYEPRQTNDRDNEVTK